RAVRTREWKLITANAGNPRGLAPEELYDLPHDPGEHRNEVASAPAEAEKMRAELGKSVLEARAHAGGAEPGQMDPATRERLEALGYVTKRVPGTYRVRFVNGSYRRVPALWTRLSAAGRRVAVLTVPATYPPEPVDGVMVSGFDSPLATAIDGSFVHPRAFYRDIRRL